MQERPSAAALPQRRNTGPRIGLTERGVKLVDRGKIFFPVTRLGGEQTGADQGEDEAAEIPGAVHPPIGEPLGCEQAELLPENADINAHGLGRELFGGMRRNVLTAEEGAVTWL